MTRAEVFEYLEKRGIAEHNNPNYYKIPFLAELAVSRLKNITSIDEYNGDPLSMDDNISGDFIFDGFGLLMYGTVTDEKDNLIETYYRTGNIFTGQEIKRCKTDDEITTLPLVPLKALQHLEYYPGLQEYLKGLNLSDPGLRNFYSKHYECCQQMTGEVDRLMNLIAEKYEEGLKQGEYSTDLNGADDQDDINSLNGILEIASKFEVLFHVLSSIYNNLFVALESISKEEIDKIKSDNIDLISDIDYEIISRKIRTRDVNSYSDEYEYCTKIKEGLAPFLNSINQFAVRLLENKKPVFFNPLDMTKPKKKGYKLVISSIAELEIHLESLIESLREEFHRLENVIRKKSGNDNKPKPNERPNADDFEANVPSNRSATALEGRNNRSFVDPSYGQPIYPNGK